MENATRALFLAAGVLIGILILTLGVYLYNSLSSYKDDVDKQMEANALNQFNTQFMQYVNVEQDGGPQLFKITMQDIVTVASLAYENNQQYGLTYADAGESSYYVKVNIENYKYKEGNTEKSKKIEGVEQYINNFTDSNAYNSAKLLSGDDGYTYICSIDNIKISNTTRRVYEITFENAS